MATTPNRAGIKTKAIEAKAAKRASKLGALLGTYARHAKTLASPPAYVQAFLEEIAGDYRPVNAADLDRLREAHRRLLRERRGNLGDNAEQVRHLDTLKLALSYLES